MPKFLNNINIQSPSTGTAEDFILHGETKTVNQLMDYWDNIVAASRLYGGKIISNGNGTVKVEAGGGLSKAVDLPISGLECDIECAPPTLNDGQGSKASIVTWAEVASLTLTDNAYNYIYYEGSTNSIKATTNFYVISFTRDFTLGRAFRTGNSVIVRLCGTNAWNFNRRVQLFGEEVFPVVKATGLVPGFSGRNISFTSGILWAELVNRFSIEAFNSATTSFTTWHRNNSGGWIRTDGQSLLNNTQWDNSSGTLQTLTAQRVGVHWLYVVHDGTAHVVFGQGNYTQLQADTAPIPSPLPPLLQAYASLVAKYEIVASASAIQSVESPQTITFTPSQTTIHNDLAELQGGTAGEYFHLTSAEVTKVTNIPTFTTVGTNLATLPNPSAIRFMRINADNTVSALTDSDFKSAIDAAATSHEHSAADITSGAIADARLSGTYSGITLKIDGANTMYTTPSSGSSNTAARTIYGLAEYRSSSSAQVGAIVFIQNNTTSSIMYQFSIAGMLYNQNIFTMELQGYRTTGAWTALKKISGGTIDIQTRFGVTPDGKNCIILGDVGTSWSYPHISITRAMISHTGASDAVASGWTTAVVTDLSAYTQVTTTITDSAITGNITGNSATATTLATARTLTIGSTGKTFDGSANVAWTLAEIGAYAATNPSGYTTNTGTVTSVAAGNGLTFTTITGSGSVTLGTPGTLTATSTDAVQTNSHTHAITTTLAGAASTIVQTDASGDITSRLVRNTFANQTTISGAIAFRINNSTDNYIRFCSDAAAIRAFIDAPQVVISATTPSGTFRTGDIWFKT